MKIPINRQLKVILLKWLKQGYMNTDDIPKLNDVRDNWFLDLMKQTDVEAEMKYTEDDMKDIPEELLVELAGHIQDAQYRRTHNK